MAYDRRVTFKRDPAAEGATNAFGGAAGASTPTADWEDIATVWASFDATGTGEKWRAGQVETRNLAWFTVRRSARMRSVSETDRILVDAEVWKITGIRRIGRGRIEFTAEMVKA